MTLIPDTVRVKRLHTPQTGAGLPQALNGVSACIVRGDLKVRCKDRFFSLLTNGLGRCKAYGYGMLLLRHPHRGSDAGYSP